MAENTICDIHENDCDCGESPGCILPPLSRGGALLSLLVITLLIAYYLLERYKFI